MAAYFNKAQLERRLTTQITGAFLDFILALNDQQLNRVRDEAAQLSETNCGWVEYALKSAILEVVDTEIESRLAAAAYTINALSKSKDDTAPARSGG